MYFEDANNDGVVDFIPLVKLTSSGELALDNNQIQIRNYCLGWMERVVTGQLPASHFMKTQYTIEQVDIATLEIARNSYFSAHPELYNWPDGTASNVPYENLPWQYPSRTVWPQPDDAGDDPDIIGTDMILANNDDHRWELFYQDWLNSVGNNIPNQASTLTKGYDLPNLEVAALGYDATLLGIAAESAAEIGVSQELWTRILSDPTTGDDRTGPGYRFLGEDITLDSVRYYNNQIRQWKMMLAENELEKINARTKLFEDIEQFADVDNLSDWATNLEGTAEAYNSFSIDDFGEAANNEGQPLDSSLVADASLWNDAHFQPFFITFSGGGAEFTQTITRTNIEEYTKTRELTGTWNDAFSAGLKVNGAGFVTDSQDLNTITETRANSETSESSLSYSYTLSDDDEQDFYLVAVIPGRGMNGPIFLNLGSAASCPFVHEEPSSYPRVVRQRSYRRSTTLHCSKCLNLLSTHARLFSWSKNSGPCRIRHRVREVQSSLAHS